MRSLLSSQRQRGGEQVVFPAWSSHLEGLHPIHAITSYYFSLIFTRQTITQEQSGKLECMSAKNIEWNMHCGCHTCGQNCDLKIPSFFFVYTPICLFVCICLCCFCFFCREYAFIPGSKFVTQSANEPNVKLNGEVHNPVTSRSVTNILSLQVVVFFFYFLSFPHSCADMLLSKTIYKI